MRGLFAIVFGMSALLPADAAQGVKRAWTLGPPGCVKVRFLRSRQTRYGGAPRCRRIYG